MSSYLYDAVRMASTTGPFGRLTQLILDLDYGDEQERLRYYETYAVIFHLQLIALPVIGAVVIGVAGRSATAPVLAMLAAAVAGTQLGILHLRRHKVPAELIAMRKRNIGYLTVYLLSFLTLIVAVIVRGSGPGFERSLGFGALLGVALGIGAVALQARRQRDLDPADPGI